jgi:hypothetical protein
MHKGFKHNHEHLFFSGKRQSINNEFKLISFGLFGVSLTIETEKKKKRKPVHLSILMGLYL